MQDTPTIRPPAYHPKQPDRPDGFEAMLQFERHAELKERVERMRTTRWGRR